MKMSAKPLLSIVIPTVAMRRCYRVQAESVLRAVG
jgi:hypothetical protein